MAFLFYYAPLLLSRGPRDAVSREPCEGKRVLFSQMMLFEVSSCNDTLGGEEEEYPT